MPAGGTRGVFTKGAKIHKGLNMQVKGDSSLNKLIILFVFDKMEVPLSENTLLDMCCSSNNWIAYMDCQPILAQLIEHGFIYEIAASGEPMYTITPDGRVCLANFFVKIPASTREEISLFVKNNRTKYRRKQECVADYYMNKDGTYTVYLKIIEPIQPLLELKFVVPNRQAAKDVYKKWEEKAANLYSLIYENLVD
ncbi:MAG: hypothetical protein DBX59_11130 [Bacillota bacterium]|nr:MAG: hypothetical protein DBX59_11130 [Bacillota bacterium]